MTASYHLDPEEQQLLDDVESGSMRSVASPELQEGLRAAARATGLKDQRINIPFPVSTSKPSAPAHCKRVCLIKR
jgi:hypothetical protein